MKIGVLTFHWAANHGAVLQTFATQRYIEKQYPENEIKIINHYPKSREITLKKSLKPNYPKVMLARIKSVFKEKKIVSFRRNFNLTNRYFTNQELIDTPPDFDILIAGSDQIWNQSYLKFGEGKITPVYFLNFGKKEAKKVALSVSFGCTSYPDAVQQIVKPYITQFDAIGVREKTGLDILSSMEIHSGVLTADPTSLLPKEEYMRLCEDIPKKEIDGSYCILRIQNKKTKNLIKKCFAAKNVKSIKNFEMTSIEEWLAFIRDSNFVITNSFHCVMFCLKFHTPFAVLLESGKSAGMNDRIITLIERFDLSDHIILNSDDAIRLASLPNINWGSVDEKMECYSNSLKEFLSSHIK